jgi:Ni,Fe-hydrogenase maturation factor
MATAITNKPKRKFNGADVDMLTTSATIVQHAIDNKAFLISKRARWRDAFFDALKTRIENAFKNILGIDNLKEQRKATDTLLQAIDEVTPLLAEFKVQIEVDFEDDNREAEILKQLGFGLLPKVQNNNQEALAELLSTFAKNMTPTLKQEIIDEEIDAALIDQISSYATIIIADNVDQEKEKGIKKTITADGITELNDIYNQTIGIAKIAAQFFTNEPTKAELFSFNKTKAALSAGVKKAASKTPTA